MYPESLPPAQAHRMLSWSGLRRRLSKKREDITFKFPFAVSRRKSRRWLRQRVGVAASAADDEDDLTPPSAVSSCGRCLCWCWCPIQFAICAAAQQLINLVAIFLPFLHIVFLEFPAFCQHLCIKYVAQVMAERVRMGRERGRGRHTHPAIINNNRNVALEYLACFIFVTRAPLIIIVIAAAHLRLKRAPRRSIAYLFTFNLLSIRATVSQPTHIHALYIVSDSLQCKHFNCV